VGAGCLIKIVPPTYYRDHHEKDAFQHVNLKHMISFAMQVSYLHAKPVSRSTPCFLCTGLANCSGETGGSPLPPISSDTSAPDQLIVSTADARLRAKWLHSLFPQSVPVSRLALQPITVGCTLNLMVV
jgi:hypothetical protein